MEWSSGTPQFPNGISIGNFLTIRRRNFRFQSLLDRPSGTERLIVSSGDLRCCVGVAHIFLCSIGADCLPVLQTIRSHCGVFPFEAMHIDHVNHETLKIYRGVGVSSTFRAMMRCFLLFFAVLRYSEPRCPPFLHPAVGMQRKRSHQLEFSRPTTGKHPIAIAVAPVSCLNL